MPGWVRELAAPAPATADEVAAVLMVEHRVAVLPQGAIIESERGAIVIRRASGRELAGCLVPYERGTAAVGQLHAWLLLPRGGSREFDRSDATDVSLLGAGVLLSDQRALHLAATEVPDGAIFAYEWSVRGAPLVAQWVWTFVRPIPVVRSRFEIELPEGSEVVAAGAPRAVDTTHQGNRWSWEMRGLAAWREIPLCPDEPGVQHTLRLSARCKLPSAPGGTEFASWQEVGQWSQRLSDPQAQLDESLRARARELTAGQTDALAQARAIGVFVQRTNYVALNLGLGLGFGYRPRPATEVLQTGYGDCKDKANLMKALLRAVGQDAWLVAVYSGDRHHVQQEWPTVRQFNHCIVALRGPLATALPAADARSPLGPIVYFDPTDPCTSFGDLPSSLQGSYGMVQSGQLTNLVRLPLADTAASRTLRRIRGVLSADGALSAEWTETESGAQAATTRCRRRAGEAGLRTRDGSVLASALHKVEVLQWSVDDRPDSSRCERRVRFAAPGFARHSGSALMSFSAGVIPSAAVPELVDTARTEPIDLDPVSFDGSVVLQLPEGWTADELPSDRRIVKDFGSLDASWKLEADRVSYRFRLRTDPVRVAAGRYEEVRDFLAAVHATERAPVVLVRR